MLASMLSLALTLALGAQSASPDDTEYFEQQVRPILAARCFECHGPEGRAKGGLRLATRAGFLAGGDSGPVVEAAGKVDAAVFLEAIGYEDEFLQMPPQAKLPDEELAVLRSWIARGAPYGAETSGEHQGATEDHAEPRVTRGDGLTGWAYEPIARPAVPESAHPIDALVRARLREAGLAPNPPADERELVRRVHFDLTGLAPRPEDVEAYVRDSDPDKWMKLVERLLEAPQYGERWGRHWLDVVRYAETNGFERDSDKPNIWRYRDWVIDAFQRDMPYDRFVLEQLAGDELPDRDHGSIIASGYLRLAQWDDEPGAGALQGRYDVLDDIVSTTGQVFLGSTIGCARCHDHKADPFDAVHYYEFMAFFHGLTDMSRGGTQVDVATPEEAAETARLEAERERQVGRLEGQRAQMTEELAAAVQARDGAHVHGVGPLRDLRYRFYRDTWATLPDFEMFRPEDSGALSNGYLDLAPRTRDNAIGFVQEGRLAIPVDGTYEFRIHADDGARLFVGDTAVATIDGLGDAPRQAEGRAPLRAGEAPLRLDWFNAVGTPILEVAWRRLEDERWRYRLEAPEGAWTAEGFDDSGWLEGRRGFGTRGTPNADVGTEWSTSEIWLRRTFHWDGQDPADAALVLHHDEDVTVYINGVPALTRGGYVVDYVVEGLSDDARAALRPGANVLAVHCRQTAGGQYVDVAVVPRHVTLEGRALREIAAGWRSLSTPRTAASDEELVRLFQARGDELLGAGAFERFRKLDERLRAERERRVPRATAFAARERGAEPPPLAVHVRGNAHALGTPVEPRIPAFLAAAKLPDITPAADGSSSGRRTALARWMAAPENPLTARVMVNRIWQHHFGQGIVATSNDFGELGERPTHPELLDWLASEFIARGWSVKALHRLILSSETWRQSARGRDDALALDPTNSLLWRTAPRRLSAEEVRDGMLAVAGMLNLERRGPSVFGRMPEAALATSSTPESVWGRSPAAQQNRRTVYIKVKRSLLTPLLVAHDMADVDASCPVRFTTILPTQALQMLNGEFPREVAAAFAARLERELPAPPSGATGSLLAARVRRGLELAFSRPASTDEVQRHVEFLEGLQREESLTERRTLELFCLTVLNLNEFVYVD